MRDWQKGLRRNWIKGMKVPVINMPIVCVHCGKKSLGSKWKGIRCPKCGEEVPPSPEMDVLIGDKIG